MKKSILFITVTALVCICSFALVNNLVEAESANSDFSGTCGDGVTYSFDSSTGTLTISGSGTMDDYEWGDITVPWNLYKASIDTIIINDAVKSIGKYAFCECSSLTSVTIGNSVTTIGEYAFCECSSLTSVTIGNSVTSVGKCAFIGCSSIASITIPDSITSIGENAFYGCSSLTSVTIPNSVSSIGDYAFGECYRLFEIINLSPLSISNGLYGLNKVNNIFTKISDASVKTEDGFVYSICDGTYYLINYTGNETELVLPTAFENSNYIIKNYAFFDCTSLTSVVIPNSVTSIGSHTFHNCKSLTSAIIPDSVTSIGNYAFDDCSSLTSVTIPNSVTSIGEWAFSGCTSLSSVTIPNSVSSIGNCAFRGCSLKTIEVSSNNTNYISDEGVLYNKTKTELIVYPACKSDETYIISDSVISIKDCAFGGCTSLTSITIPDSVTSIGFEAFYGCSSLSSVTFSESSKLETIGESAFCGCLSLTSVTIPNSVTSIGNSAFERCSSITSITIPDSVTSIGKYAFRDCTSHISIIIGSSVTSIGTGTFENCSSLTSVTIPNTVTSIGEYAFCDCSSLDSVTLSDSVTSIGDGTFENCSSLTSILFNGTPKLKTVGYQAFRNCSSLTSVTIPDSVTSIGNNAFIDCTSLISVTIGSSVNYIGSSAFYNCYRLFEIINLSSLNINNGSYGINGVSNIFTEKTNATVKTEGNFVYGVNDGLRYLISYIGDETKLVLPTTPDGSKYAIIDSAFSECTSLTSVIIPDSVTSIGEKAFYGCTSLTSVSIGDSVTSVGNLAFANCDAIKELTLPISLDVTTSNYNHAFDFETIEKITFTAGTGKGCDYDFSTSKSTPWIFSCSVLKEIVLSEGIVSIGNYTFSYCSSLTSVTIPNTVTSIGEYAFYNCSSLDSVTLSNSVTSIGDWTFSHCSSLTSVNIPGSVTSVGNEAFYGCTSLTSVNIPGSVTSVGNEAFYGCTSLTSVSIGNSVTSIGESAFYDCSSLTSIIIPSSMTSIENGVFSGCTSLSSVTIPNSVTSIGNYAFEDCSSLTSVTIPDSVTSIGFCAFGGCTGLKTLTIPISLDITSNNCVFWSCHNIEKITFTAGTGEGCSYDYSTTQSTPWHLSRSLNEIILSEGITSIGNWIFSDCSSLKSITISNSVTSIGDWAFSYCSSLASITIHDSMISIGDSAFNGCSSLTSITIPNSVTSIGNQAFFGCSLESIDVDSGNTNYVSDGGVLFNKTKTELIAYPTCKSNETYIVPDSVTSIRNYAFYENKKLESVFFNKESELKTIEEYAFGDCASLISVTIPDSVTFVGDFAFSGCKHLTSVTIGNSVTTIGEYAFCECSSLTSFEVSKDNGVYSSENGILFNKLKTELTKYPASKSELTYDIPNSVTCIGVQAFSGCTSLTSVVIPNSVTSIGDDAFRSCTSLTSVTIPDSITHIGVYTFSGCSSITSVTIPGSVTGIGVYAFSECSSLTSVIISDSVTSIEYCAFEGCTSLSSIIFSESSELETIGDYAFHSCTSLTSVTIPDSVTSIESGAFYGCTSLISVTIPDSVTTIKEGTFSNCTALTSASIPNSVITIRSYAFSGCTSLTSVIISDSVTSIGWSAFEGCSSLTSVTIPNSVISIGYGAFSGTTFYDADGTTELEATAENLKGNIFRGDNGKLVKCETLTLTFESVNGIKTDALYVKGDVSVPEPSNTILAGYTCIWPEYKLNGTITTVKEIKTKNSNTVISVSDVDGRTYYCYGDSLELVYSYALPADVNINWSAMTLDGASVVCVPEGDTSTFIDTTNCNGTVRITLTITDGTTTKTSTINVIPMHIGNTTYTVRFIDGTKVFDEETITNKTIYAEGSNFFIIPSAPTKSGYKFEGWYTDKSLNAETLVSTPVTENIDFYAKWSYSGSDEGSSTTRIVIDHDIIVTFDTVIGVEYNVLTAGSGVVTFTVNAIGGFDMKMDTLKVTAGKEVIIPSGNNYFVTDIDEDTAITIICNREAPEPRTYRVTFTADGETISEKTLDYGTIISVPENPVKESTVSTEYSFTGWNGYSEGMTVTGDMSFTALFSEKIREYTVTFVIDKNETSEKYNYGTPAENIAVPKNPSKTADAQYTYTFSKWDSVISDVTGDITYTAVFTETVNKYTITFIVEGKTVEKKVLDYGSAITAPENPVKEATVGKEYSFSGWNGYFDGIIVTENTSFTALFNERTRMYTVIFDVDGNKTTAEYDYGTSAGNIAVPTASKTADAQYTYTFSRWDPAISTVTKNVTYTAVFTKAPKEYTVTFFVDGQKYSEKNVNYGSSISKPGTPTKTGYTFQYWAKNGSEFNFSEKMPAYDVTLNAVWEIRQYTVTFYSDGVKFGEKTVNYDSAFSSAGTPTKTGYTFQYWSKDGINAYSFSERMPANNFSLTAVWKVNQYIVTFIVDGKRTSGTYDYGTSAGSISTPDTSKEPTVRYTYTFAGWNPSITSVTSNTTYTATYTEFARLYTISFKNGDGSTISESRIGYGEAIKAPTPVKESDVAYDYEFKEWVDSSGRRATVPGTVSGDVTLYASYTQKQREYTVTFSSDGEEYAKYVLGYGEKIVIPSVNPTKSADSTTTYEFTGWNGYTEDMTVPGECVFTAIYLKTAIVDKSSEEYTAASDDDGARFDSETISSIKTNAETDENITMSVTIGKSVVSFDNEALKSLTDGEAELNVNELKENQMTDKVKEIVGKNVAFSITFGNNISFGNGQITVTVPYTLEDGKDPGKLKIYYIADGRVAEEKECLYSEGYVTFVTNHFSTYAVMYIEPVGENNIIMIVAIAVAVVAVIAVAGTFIVKRKKTQ